MAPLEPFLATGIGSLPHEDEAAAFRLILHHFPEIPFWPQLPKRSPLEAMVSQYSEGFPCVRWEEEAKRLGLDTSEGFEAEIERFYQDIEADRAESFAMTERYAKGLEILQLLSQEPYRKRIQYVKGQIIGPITFGLSLTDREKRPIFYDPTLRDMLVKHLRSKARWMIQRFHQALPDKPVLLFFDEPSLASFGSAFSGLDREDVLEALNACLGGLDGLRGIHCCGNTDWSLILSTDIDVLSFDAYGFAEHLSLYPKELQRFLERGGILAWGIVPTNETILREDVSSLKERFRQAVETLCRKGFDRERLRHGILTPSCGLGSLSVPLAERACRLTSELSLQLREKEGDWFW